MLRSLSERTTFFTPRDIIDSVDGIFRECDHAMPPRGMYGGRSWLLIGGTFVMQDWDVWVYRPRGVESIGVDGDGEGIGDDRRCDERVAGLDVV